MCRRDWDTPSENCRSKRTLLVVLRPGASMAGAAQVIIEVTLVTAGDNFNDFTVSVAVLCIGI
jgi:hypothetical protein